MSVEKVFDPAAILVSANKSLVGHAMAAAGALEAIATVLTLVHQLVPPTANLHTPDPECDLDYTPLTARERQLDAVLTVGSGFGGFQSAMVLTAPRGRAA